MNDAIVATEIENLRTEISDIKKLMLKRFKDLEGYLSNIEDELTAIIRL